MSVPPILHNKNSGHANDLIRHLQTSLIYMYFQIPQSEHKNFPHPIGMELQIQLGQLLVQDEVQW